MRGKGNEKIDTDVLNPQGLFQAPIRYTIPAFQRRYVWEQDDQWEPLWDDVRKMAERYLEELDRSGNDRVLAAKNVAPHFLGAIVIRQVSVGIGDIARWEVIDGQQRMTTLQLLLDAVQHTCEDLGLDNTAKRLSMLVSNNEYLIREEDQVFKLWPTTEDQEAFRRAMNNKLATDGFEDSLIVQAHEYFQLHAQEWLSDYSDPDLAPVRAEALEAAVSGLLQVVVISIPSEDDPYIIFETLNARGTPLLESNLIKNYVMSLTGEVDQSSIWGDLDEDWWSEDVYQGRLLMPRKDALLNYWMVMRKGDPIRADNVFRSFRNHINSLSVGGVMADLKRDLGNYRRFEEGMRTPDEERFHYRVSRVMRIGVITPALLLILRVPREEERVKALQALESYLVWRMLCRGDSKDYNRLTLDLVYKLNRHGLDNAGEVVFTHLKEQESYSREWPDYQTLEDNLVRRHLYRVLTRGKLRLVLEGIEETLRTSMSEQIEVPKDLTIEHVMPQSWESTWPLRDRVDQEDATDRRNSLVHTIGNLTLINGYLNSSLSNAPWEDKRETLGKHSILHLNKDLLEESRNKDWDEEFIQARSKRMAKLVAQVWPGPDSPVWD